MVNLLVQVHTVSASRVFQAEAYLLFYTKAVPNHHQTPSKVNCLNFERLFKFERVKKGKLKG